MQRSNITCGNSAIVTCRAYKVGGKITLLLAQIRVVVNAALLKLFKVHLLMKAY